MAAHISGRSTNVACRIGVTLDARIEGVDHLARRALRDTLRDPDFIVQGLQALRIELEMCIRDRP